MASDTPEGPSPPILTAVDLHEETFPFPGAHGSDSSQGTSLKPSATDGGAPGDFPPKPDSSASSAGHVDRSTTRPTAPPAFPRAETQRHTAVAPRPEVRHTVTESASTRPRPNMAASFLQRRRGEGATRDKQPARPKQAPRQATLTFDSYSSDSSSPDEDEPMSPVSINNEEEKKQQQKPQKPKKQFRSPPPFSRFKLANEHFHTRGKVSKLDGRLKLNIHETVNSGYFAKTLGAGLKKHFPTADEEGSAKNIADERAVEAEKIPPEEDEMEHDPSRRVKLNVVIIVIGSRGDIQPFLKIGKILKEDYGHRVRIATHPAFKNFVEEDSGLEFFSVGGNPSELMAFMVKNPGLLPNMDTIKEGEVGRRRAAMYEMFKGMWRSCINSTDDEADEANLKMMGTKEPFIADAIIANPPSFAPPHIAERLGIPLHMMFTFPYTPTVQFPHPLANIKTSNVDASYTNFMSYPLVEMMTWQGLGDLINRFRAKTLFLEEVSTLWAPGQLYRLKVPYTYMWSPSLVGKPKDWGPEIDIAGFVFLDLASSFTPPDNLSKFLDAGPPPIYIGFGSIVVDDPDRFTKLIFEAVKIAGVRALVSSGWGGFGSNETAPDNIFMLENTPHDWLFPRVSAVVHHGGAGTTAIGLKCGKPTMIVPFFGDQPFWGAMVSKAKAGSHECIPYKQLTAERLAAGIKQCLTDEARENVQKIADSIANEGDGARNAVRSFHRSLPLRGKGSMRCDMLANRVAAWRLKDTSLRLSPMAAELLVEWKKIKWNELRLLRIYEWNDFGGPGEPVTGVWGSMVGTASDIATGVGLIPVKMAKSVKQRERYYEKKYKIIKRQKRKKKTLERANQGIPNGGTNGANHATTNGNTAPPKRNERPAAPKRAETTMSQLSEPDDYLAEELAQEAGHGFKKTGAAILRSPMNFTLALSQGFHNAPRLYGDETVRRPPRITGFYSGLRAGRDEFIYGIHDGVSGIWQQPFHGAKEGGFFGCARGVGMGIGGFVLKDIAALLAPPAYFMKGLNEEHMKKYQPTDFLRRARIIQGQKELETLGSKTPRAKSGNVRRAEDGDSSKRQEVELDVSKKWEAMQDKILSEKKKHRTGIRAALTGRSQKKEGSRIPIKPPRSSISANANPNRVNGGPKKAPTAPVKETEKLPAENGQLVKNEDAPGRASLEKTASAPGKAEQWKEKGGGKRKKDRFEGVDRPLRQEAQEQGAPKQSVPGVFRASLEGNGVPVGHRKPNAMNGGMEILSSNSEDEPRRTASDTTAAVPKVGAVDGKVQKSNSIAA